MLQSGHNVNTDENEVAAASPFGSITGSEQAPNLPNNLNDQGPNMFQHGPGFGPPMAPPALYPLPAQNVQSEIMVTTGYPGGKILNYREKCSSKHGKRGMMETPCAHRHVDGAGKYFYSHDDCIDRWGLDLYDTCKQHAKAAHGPQWEPIVG